MKPSTTPPFRRLALRAVLIGVGFLPLILTSTGSADGPLAYPSNLNVQIQPKGVDWSDIMDIFIDKKIDATEAITVAGKALSNYLSKVVAEGQLCREACAQLIAHGNCNFTISVTLQPAVGSRDKPITYEQMVRVSALPGGGKIAVGIYRPGTEPPHGQGTFDKIQTCECRGAAAPTIGG